MNKPKHIHFVGIKGVGVTPLAIIAKEAGIAVTGSDVGEKFITDEALEKSGISPLVGFAKEHISKKIDLVITTGAHGGYDNVEVVQAKNLGIPVLTKGEAVGAYMKGELLERTFSGIAIAGSHGKTTTSGMIVTMLKANAMDPSYVVGTGSIGAIDLPGHLGKGRYFVAESDEYATEPKHDHKAQFLWQYPQIALFTNIEHDHPDIYPKIEDVIKVFGDFVENIPKNGLLIGCGDDEVVYTLLRNARVRTLSYGFSPKNDYVLSRVHVSGAQTFFHITTAGVDLGEFRIGVIGEHNALNAAGAIVVGFELGLTMEQISQGLSKFTGSKRRLEYRGKLETGAHVFDDYAHHPTEIRQTLKSLRLRFPKETIVAIFQPHTYSRTKALMNDFVKAFQDANDVIIIDIFPSAREEIDPTISSQLLASKLSMYHPAAFYAPSVQDAIQLLRKEDLRDNVVIVFMGAGDIYNAIDTLPFAA
jgi:UDP-N-acetylmuramate--alanine ligase